MSLRLLPRLCPVCSTRWSRPRSCRRCGAKMCSHCFLHRSCVACGVENYCYWGTFEEYFRLHMKPSETMGCLDSLHYLQASYAVEEILRLDHRFTELFRRRDFRELLEAPETYLQPEVEERFNANQAFFSLVVGSSRDAQEVVGRLEVMKRFRP